MQFTKPWIAFPADDELETRVPALAVYLPTADGGSTPEIFVVDSGADISMASRELCHVMGLTWEAGTPVQLRGISPRDDCAVPATIHQVKIYVAEAARELTIPFCFAEGNAPALLAREGFFDAFRITFDKTNYVTTFEW
jgi:hypothetical protein